MKGVACCPYIDSYVYTWILRVAQERFVAGVTPIRRAEAAAEAAAIGAEFHRLSYPDEFLLNNAETRLRFIDLVRAVPQSNHLPRS